MRLYNYFSGEYPPPSPQPAGDRCLSPPLRGIKGEELKVEIPVHFTIPVSLMPSVVLQVILSVFSLRLPVVRVPFSPQDIWYFLQPRCNKGLSPSPPGCQFEVHQYLFLSLAQFSLLRLFG